MLGILKCIPKLNLEIVSAIKDLLLFEVADMEDLFNKYQHQQMAKVYLPYVDEKKKRRDKNVEEEIIIDRTDSIPVKDIVVEATLNYDAIDNFEL